MINLPQGILADLLNRDPDGHADEPTARDYVAFRRYVVDTYDTATLHAYYADDQLESDWRAIGGWDR